MVEEHQTHSANENKREKSKTTGKTGAVSKEPLHTREKRLLCSNREALGANLKVVYQQYGSRVTAGHAIFCPRCVLVK